MKLIQKLCDMIDEEIGDAEKYAKCAIDNKESDPVLAETFFKLSNEELGHMNVLHDQAVRLIEAYKKEKGIPPEHMLILYDIVHKKEVSKAATVRGMLNLYKEMPTK